MQRQIHLASLETNLSSMMPQMVLDVTIGLLAWVCLDKSRQGIAMLINGDDGRIGRQVHPKPFGIVHLWYQHTVGKHGYITKTAFACRIF